GRLRIVSERNENVEDRVFIIGSSIHGTGKLAIVSEVAHGNHKSSIYIQSENNDFSGDVFIESGTHIHIDDNQHEHYYYDYQTNLYLTGKNALYNAAHILNEGIVNITADQIFKNYDGDDSVGQYTGVGQLIINEGVTVELVYDNNAYSAEPIGLITVVTKENKSGNLVINVADGVTKTITMSENSEDYSKIEGQGTIVKAGDGTLQIVSSSAGLIGSESFVISSGRLDIEGYFAGSILVGSDTLDDEVIFSPGVPKTPDYVNIDGELILTDSATLLMEIGGAETPLLNDQLILTDGSSFSYTENTVVRFNPLPGYTPAKYDIIPVKMPEFNWDKAKFSSDAFVLLKYENGIQYLGINPNYVPEPATWALMILGAAGMLYFRKRK
ncbi:MAG: PEP-CTERM sorting domain-containing protein, partial [Thermoguttaceae bacterium]|nr:PEP-CTERM sorting domain-containing protein [Thermoguttaceae bacterium]